MIKPAPSIVVYLLAFIITALPFQVQAGTSTKTKKQTTNKVAAKPASKAAAKRKESRKEAVTARNTKAGVKTKAKPQARTEAMLARAKPRKSEARIREKAPIARAQGKAPVQAVKFAPGAAVAPAPAILPPAMTAGDMAGLNHTHDPLALRSNAAIVVDQTTTQVLLDKNADVALPIASLTKLMTAVVVVESRQDMNEVLEVTSDDIDRERHSASRLRVGARLSRADMLHIALMSSENRAASALGRNYPGGLPAFVAAMNAKAKALGMTHTRYADSTGLSGQNVASARDLSRLVAAAYRHPLIREYSTYPRYAVDIGRGQLQYVNSNRLVLNPGWEIGLQKTGFINEAGHCLVMQARIEGRPVVMVFLDSKGKDSRLADAGRIRKWLEVGKNPQALTLTAATQG